MGGMLAVSRTSRSTNVKMYTMHTSTGISKPKVGMGLNTGMVDRVCQTKQKGLGFHANMTKKLQI